MSWLDDRVDRWVSLVPEEGPGSVGHGGGQLPPGV